MTAALLDTNVLFASASARDEYHDRAVEIIRGIDHGDLPEAIVANGLLDRLITGAHFDIVHAPQSDFNAAQPIFRQYPELSFVDATIAAYIDRKGIESLYSFDDDFDAVDDIVRLATATNPYRS